jgi:hypothetical protein
MSGDVSDYAAEVLCDGVLQIWAASQENPVSPVTGPVLVEGMSRFGTAHTSALAFGTELSASRHDGITSYETMHWDDAKCQCFVYDDGLHRFP